MSYRPPTTRKEAVDEILRSGFTTSAILAVACAFPLPGELHELHTTRAGALLLEYADDACWYLHQWGRASLPVSARPAEWICV